jgi:hypothetical protein
VPGYRERPVTLTKEGRCLLERHQDRDDSDRQTFYNGVKREGSAALAAAAQDQDIVAPSTRYAIT